jgi:hypothetical protein
LDYPSKSLESPKFILRDLAGLATGSTVLEGEDGLVLEPAAMLDSGPWLTFFLFVVFDIVVGFGGNNTNLSHLLLSIHRLVSKVTTALRENTANAPPNPLSSRPFPYLFIIECHLLCCTSN